MVQLKLDLNKVSLAAFVAVMEDNAMFLDTSFSSLEEARAAFPKLMYREVSLMEDGQ
jgi:hypothetical protein